MNEQRAVIENSRVLVVGGAGFVGSNLVSRLLDDGAASVHIVDNFLSAEPENVPEDSRVSISGKSINDDSVLREVGTEWDIVFHLATYHGNQSSIANPHEDHENNLRTTLVIADHFSGSSSLKSLVYASAGCTVAEKTYDDAQATNEDDPISLYLDSPYQISKIVGELYLNYFERSSGLPSVKARFQNVYGPREILGAGEWRGTPATVWRNVIPTFIYRAIKGYKLSLDNDGMNSRDFIYVEDLVDGLVRCATYGEIGGIYNLASGVETSIKRLAEVIMLETASKSELEMLPARDWDRSGRRFGSTGKSQTDLGFLASTSLETGIHRTVQWAKDNFDFITETINKHSDRVESFDA
ncbi:MAG: NAD-dependent epimerase/dehydratase family protein [Acidimicrobiales bacterium]|jgi:UDP-glucose 4-epimerase|nr:NAD-dependent epimerase/dehydratase family protein [Acidimicrobiales bacterium]